jgi:hypothetical protein
MNSTVGCPLLQNTHQKKNYWIQANYVIKKKHKFDCVTQYYSFLLGQELDWKWMTIRKQKHQGRKECRSHKIIKLFDIMILVMKIVNIIILLQGNQEIIMFDLESPSLWDGWYFKNTSPNRMYECLANAL